ncbi:MAG: helix-turn-helix domain-containing protein [Bacteroidetes bacterium]|nr:MAG: helix-turn-helix domain-containing protein [Bacteroidota bacterium]
MVGKNLKILRKHYGNSQEEMARLLELTRSSYSGYENNVAEPSIGTLIRLSDIYGISLDIILKKDLSTIPEHELESYLQDLNDYSGKHLRILTNTVNTDNEELIELIPEKARAGYSLGYSDPEYLKILPTFSLPFLSRDRKYRSFPIKGDSMPPVSEGSYVVAEYIQNWMLIKDKTPCIVVTKDEGIVFKVVYNNLRENQSFSLHSTNPEYKAYDVQADQILEIWKFVNYISPDLPEVRIDDSHLKDSLQEIQKDISELKSKIGKSRKS